MSKAWDVNSVNVGLYGDQLRAFMNWVVQRITTAL
jgi:methylaspartate ammonia-lyase